MTIEAEERLWSVAGPYLEAEGVVLDDLEVRGQGAGRIVRVTVDAEGGIGVDRIADISRHLGRIIEEGDLLTGPFLLEVSSPGLERPLRRFDHYRKAIGSEVVVKTTEAVDGARHHRGVARGAEDEAVTVEIDGVARRIPVGVVSSARTVFRWEKAPKPGRK